MIKTIRKKITVLLIMSMLLQLFFVGVAPAMAEDLSEQNAEPIQNVGEDVGEDAEEESEFVQLLPIILSLGTTTGAISAKIIEDVYGSLIVNITEQEIATPHVGDAAPTVGDNLIADYELGADITAGVAAGNYLQIYDVDMEEGAQIVAFYQAELTEEDIKEDIEVDLEADPDQNLDEDLEEGAGEDIEEGAEAEPVESLMMGAELLAGGGYSYVDENGDTKNTGDKTVTKITSDTYTLNDGWYIVEGNINRTGTIYSSGSITVSGNVHLILADDSSLTVNGYNDAGINVSENNCLTIYAQSKEDKIGSLNATGDNSAAGIGGNNGNCGNITINGGIVTATSATYGSGIGGGYEGNSRDITINGGTVTATGGAWGAGIGGGNRGSGGNITINGGTVTAKGVECGAGIGGGWHGNGGTIIINNYPTVIATGNKGGADIGNGFDGNGTTIIKHDTTGGTDLTYVRLEVQNLSPENENKITFNEQEHAINNDGITGFFVEKSTKSLDIILEPISSLLNINPGDVQNRRITISKDDYADPVAGFGSALDFPANLQSRINIPFEETKIGGNSNFTISMWIFPRENEPYQTLYRQNGDNRESLGLDFRFIKFNDDEGYLYFGFNRLNYGWQNAFPWNDETSLANITKIPMNRWTHVALTKSGKNIILYANGTKYYEMTLDSKHYDAPAPLAGNISIGGTTVADQFFSGRMDEIQFWNTALNPDEIAAWMYREIDKKHPKYNNLVFYYRLNQNSGTTVIDSKKSYNGTAVNMTDNNWVTSDVRDWTVEAGSILRGELAGSHGKGSSNDGIDWNLTFEIAEQAKKGIATIIGDNKFEYRTKDTEQKGHDSFTYRVKGFDGADETIKYNLKILSSILIINL